MPENGWEYWGCRKEDTMGSKYGQGGAKAEGVYCGACWESQYEAYHLRAVRTFDIQRSIVDDTRTSTSILAEDTITLHSNQEKNLADTHNTALEIQNRQVAQETVLQETRSILAKLHDVVAGDVVPQLKSLLNMANRVWK